MNKFRRSVGVCLALEIIVAVAALVSSGCVTPSEPNPQPGCASGTGILAFQNNSGEAVQVDLVDSVGSLPSIPLGARQSLNETEPTGSYEITVTGSTSHRELLKQTFAVKCDTSTPVVITPEAPLLLSVGLSGSGQGSVSSAPAGVQCSSGICSAGFQPNSQVVLTAQPQSNSKFTSWGGACSGNLSTCTVTMSQAQSVTAQFDTTLVSTKPHLNYYGGPIITNPRLIMVLWGTNVDTTTQSKLPLFLAAVPANSQFNSIVNQYTNNSGGFIHASTFVGSYTLSGIPASTSITDDQIQSTLTSSITQGKLPANDANTIYVIAMPAGYKVTMGGSSSCSQFCGYHSTVSPALSSSGAIPYVVLSDLGHDGCELGCGSGTAFSNLTALATQELASAMTDPEVGLASSYAPPLGWYDPQGSDGEIGDICNGQQSTVSINGSVWTTSKLWSNADNACVSARVASAVQLSGTPSSQSAVASGSAATYAITAVGVPKASLTLVAVGLPAGVTATFSPTSISLGGSSTLTIQAAADVAPGNYLFMVQSTDGTSTVSTGLLSLTVTAH